MRIVTHAYDSYDLAHQAALAVEASGIDHSAITFASGDVSRAPGEPVHDRHEGAGTGATFGAYYGGGLGLAAGLGLLAVPGLAPIVAAGWLVTTLVGAGIGAAAGGVAGTLTDLGIDALEAVGYAKHVEEGGSLVSVKVAEDGADAVEAILAAHDAPLEGAVPADPAAVRRPGNAEISARRSAGGPAADPVRESSSD